MATATDTKACRSCGARVVWVETATGKRMPLDAEPVPDGNVVLGLDGVARYLGRGADPPVEANRYRSHFATCPDGAAWRRR